MRSPTYAKRAPSMSDICTRGMTGKQESARAHATVQTTMMASTTRMVTPTSFAYFSKRDMTGPFANLDWTKYPKIKSCAI